MRISDWSSDVVYFDLWPLRPEVWNARLLVYAFTERAPAALALLDDVASRPVDLTPPSIESWRAALNAFVTRSSADVARAVTTCTAAARLAPGLAANAIMAFSQDRKSTRLNSSH